MNITWVFQTKTIESGDVLVCVNAPRFEVGWSVATLYLLEAGQTPTKANGYFGFVTVFMSEYCEDVPQGVISEEQHQALRQEHFAAKKLREQSVK